jgi:hypothetical protein
MFVEMVCGACESSINIDSEEEDAVWMVVHRFANAHAGCGFMAPVHLDAEIPSGVKVIKPRMVDESEES